MDQKEEIKVPRYREFTVTPGVCGFKVKIGCSELYFSDIRVLSDAITEYLLNPQRTEELYLSRDKRLSSLFPQGQARISGLSTPDTAR